MHTNSKTKESEKYRQAIRNKTINSVRSDYSDQINQIKQYFRRVHAILWGARLEEKRGGQSCGSCGDRFLSRTCAWFACDDNQRWLNSVGKGCWRDRRWMVWWFVMRQWILRGFQRRIQFALSFFRFFVLRVCCRFGFYMFVFGVVLFMEIEDRVVIVEDAWWCYSCRW